MMDDSLHVTASVVIDHRIPLKDIVEKYAVPPAGLVGKLPKVSCRECTQNNGSCSKHAKQRCNVCDAYISTAHVHLDYVGHAETTRILIDIDPLWTWEPVEWIGGAPAVVDRGREWEMWGRMTVLGKTLPCVGSVPKDKVEAGKQLIGDLIRNGAMRFGVALSLWSKQEWDDLKSEAPTPPQRGDWRQSALRVFTSEELSEAAVCGAASRGKRLTLDEFADSERDALQAAFIALRDERKNAVRASVGAGSPPDGDGVTLSAPSPSNNEGA